MGTVKTRSGDIMKTELTECKCGSTFKKEEGKTECDGCLFKKINEKEKLENKFDFRILS